ncbi:hypothetical protein HDG37_001743 [Paraburkholderia sp. MM5384-R2]|nr:hypothetical protein [Paraburkholderia sp. MM5384-R2]
MTSRSRSGLMPASPSSRLPINRVAGFHLARLTAFAGHVKPVIAGGVDLDVSQGHIGQFTDPQSRRATEIQHETKSLRGGSLPAVRPLEPVGDGTREQPFWGASNEPYVSRFAVPLLPIRLYSALPISVQCSQVGGMEQSAWRQEKQCKPSFHAFARGAVEIVSSMIKAGGQELLSKTRPSRPP